MKENDNLKLLINALNDVKSQEIIFSSKSKKNIPSRQIIERIIDEIRALLFPSIFLLSHAYESEAEKLLNDLLKVVDEGMAWEILFMLPKIKSKLLGDIMAIYDGDPAATSYEEIILSYPGFYATLVYRISHWLYLLSIPFIPRLMSEIAHEKTGIDIHPGAKIGERFCIDHGTGIVIGETASIGDRVKIYQGVTIGAKSFETDCDGRLVKGEKRHPDVGNDCVIYANATILGGETKIGDGCVIGGNVWLTHSVPAGQTVYFKEK